MTISNISAPKADLTNCDREPIHIPGNIQTHGFMIAINKNREICYCSENMYALTRLEAGILLGKTLDDFVSAITERGAISPIPAIVSLFSGGHNTDQLNPSPVHLLGRDYNLIISGSGEYLILEIEPAIPERQGLLQKMIGQSLSKMLIDKNLDHLIDNTARQVRSVIGFDRVMVYRFSQEGHGEVIAESKTNELGSWMGQHFPATDIPTQARELYKKNLTRLIANVADEPSRILASAGSEHLDLTHAQLRAVSPIHIQYLKNMGVVSSFSISLIYQEELWGLIACHNYTPKFIEYTARESAKLIGQILSSALEFRQDELNHQIQEDFNHHLDLLSKQMTSQLDLSDALTADDTNLLSIVNATGVVLFRDNKLDKMGEVPDSEPLGHLINWLKDTVDQPIFYTDHLDALFPQAKGYRHIASGLFIVVISWEPREFIIYFKPEQISTVSWAGNMDLENSRKSDPLLQISPRNSFDLWAEVVRGKSLPWTKEEISSLKRLRQEIAYAINHRANDLKLTNEKLTAAYDELDTFSYSVSHDLKNPITSIKIHAQLLLRDTSLSVRSRQISANIHTGANKMDKMVEEVLEYSRIGRLEPNYKQIECSLMIEEICAEIRLIYQEKCPEITFGKMHHIQADLPMITRVFANLIGNAAKYSNTQETPKIHIESALIDGMVSYSISDNGIGIKPVDMPRIFDLFSRMSNVGQIEGTGVGLAIVKRIVERHKGEIYAESEYGIGTTLYLKLNAPLIG